MSGQQSKTYPKTCLLYTSDILRLINDNPKILFTVKELQNRFSITHTTAKNDIDGLVERKLVDEISLNKVKKGYVKGELFDKTVKLSLIHI